MRIVADLHLHSKHARAVSKKMIPKTIAWWAARKGLDLVATADWTQPLWLRELEAALKEVGKGVYCLKDSVIGSGQQFPVDQVKFVLSTEISSIYSQGGVTRKIHNLVLAPDFQTVRKINQELKGRGCNLMADGRPIIGLSSIQLAELVWGVNQNCLIIPAHIWTPWFAMFGSKSGFDSIEECWGDYRERIQAIETGLSSDPEMNWRIEELDQRAIVSFSDAHSPSKLAREATVLELEKPDFDSLSQALKPASQQNNNKILYTIEFYPEEGKYHYSGHRKCQVVHAPEETKKKGGTCPVCGKPLTLGVMYRVEELAAKKAVEPVKKTDENGLVKYYHPEDQSRPPYTKLVPLMEILSEVLDVGVKSKTVRNEYEKLTRNLGSELDILTQIKSQEIAKIGGEKLAEAVKKVRSGKIVVEPGYDGLFGNVRIWKRAEEASQGQAEQASLF